MNARSNCMWTLFVFLLTAASAFAQEQRQTGLLLTSAPGIGLIWHLSDRLAIRPEVSFSRTTLEADVPDVESTGSAFNLSVSGMFTVRRWADLSAYVSPRFLYQRASGRSTTSPGSQTIETTTTGYGVVGSFGAQYQLGDRFAIFGETGLSFLDQKTTSDSIFLIGERRGTSTGTRSAVGAVFYF